MLVKYIIMVGRKEVFLLNDSFVTFHISYLEFPFVVIQFIKLERQELNDFQLINQSECVIFLI